MEWIAVVAAIVAVVFFALYQKSLKENRNLTNFALMVLNRSRRVSGPAK